MERERMDEWKRPYTKEELLHGVALIEAHLAEDEEAVNALHSEDGDGARQAARAMFALAHLIVFGLVIPDMWVVKKGFSFGETSNVPELNLAICMLQRMEERVELAHVSPVVPALSAGDVMALIVQCTGTKMADVPAFLGTVRERTLASMAPD